MGDNYMGVIADIQKIIIKNPEAIKEFEVFDEETGILEELNFKKLGIIENISQEEHMSYIMILANPEKGVDAVITEEGNIVFGTLFSDNSIIDTGNYQGASITGSPEFEYNGYPGEELEEIYEHHLASVEERIDARNIKPVSSHLENLEDWLKNLKKTAAKFVAEDTKE